MKKLLFVLLFSVLITAGASIVAAQEPENGEEGAAAKEESPLQTVFRWTNAILLFGGLGYLLRRPAREFFQTRQQEITSGIRRAEETEAGAKLRMNEIDRRLSKLSEEVAALRAAAEKESEAEHDKMRADTRREIERIVEQSRLEIERIARSVEREIKEDIADLVIDRAENTLRTQMTQDDQKRVILHFIKKL